MTRARPSPDPLDGFTPVFREWFERELGEPSEPQRQGWPAIRRGEHTLILSPTGSGKTLAAFYGCLDDAHRRLLADGEWPGVHTLYVSPLKALNHDVHRNLRVPLDGIERLARERGEPFPEIEVAVRTGDTPQRERQRMVRAPPHVLITTPESLYLLLLAKSSRAFLRNVRYVIVDEIHSMAGTKRGVHLALSMERLSALQEGPEPVRVGLSATIKPLEEVARFLGGRDRPVTVVDAGLRKRVDVDVVSPVADFASADGGTVWNEVYPKLHRLAHENRTTLVFANNRRLAERVSARLNALHLDEHAPPELSRDSPRADLVPGHKPDPKKKRQFLNEFSRAHHGSMSRESRLEIEALLKEGLLPTLVATSSLELGIDVGSVDCVALLGSPKGVARGLQRVGRSGHTVGETAVGRFFPLFREDLVESAVIARAMLEGDVEETHTPENALDVLAQQLVADVAADAVDGGSGVRADDLFDLARRAHPYRNLTRRAFDGVLEMLAGKYPHREFRHLAARLSWDRRRGTLHALPGSRMLATRNGGTIPDRGYYGCYLASDATTKLGELDEEFVYETRVGDVFLLGSQTWRVAEIDRDRVLVLPAPGEPPRMPFWRGEGIWRDFHLSMRVARFRREVEERLDDPGATEWLMREYRVDAAGAASILRYFMEMREEAGVIPSDRTVLVESFRDEIGDPRVVVHAPFGGRVTGPWALALAARLRESLGTDVQTLVNDDGILMRFPDADAAPPAADIVRAVRRADADDLVVREVGHSPVFAARFRENAERALLLPKGVHGKRTPLWMQRLRAQDLLEVARKHDDFPIILETYRDVVTDVFDVDGLALVLGRIESGDIQVVTRETDHPSPFAASLLFQFVGAYLYEGDRVRPEERATLLSLDRDLLQEVLGRASLRDLLRADAVAAVEDELQHATEGARARSAEELHHLLIKLGALDADAAIAKSQDEAFLDALLASGRAMRIAFPEGSERVAAAEDAPLYERAWAGDDAAADALARRALAAHGPITVDAVARETGLALRAAERALDKLAAEGVATSGEFLPGGTAREWADRENLARCHRRTLDLLRREIEAVPIDAYARFLLRWHGLHEGPRAGGAGPLRETLRRLEGLPLPGESWERDVLATRFRRYDAKWMQPLTESGEWAWVAAGERGRFLPVMRGRAGLFLVDDAETPRVPEAEAALAALREHGALPFADLRAATGLDPTALTRGLHALAVAGVVTNDNFLVMRHVFRHPKVPKAVGPLSRDAPRVRRPRRGARGVVAARGAFAGPFAVGRWSVARSPLRLGPERLPAERAAAVADVLLERYGVVAREIVEREGVLPWKEVSRALKRKEMRGEARRGYFVAGLSGLQFAHLDAVETLRAARVEPEERVAVLVGSIDPANPYGTGLDAGMADAAGNPIKFSRTPSTHVALVAGRPVVVSEGFGARLTRVAGAPDADVVAALKALTGLAELPAGLRPRRRVLVESVDGAAPTAEGARQLLLEAGFEAEAGRMVYRPHV